MGMITYAFALVPSDLRGPEPLKVIQSEFYSSYMLDNHLLLSRFGLLPCANALSCCFVAIQYH